MKRFAALFLDLDQTNKTNAKVELLRDYFSNAGESDKIWALALFCGRRPSFKVSSTQVRNWACEEAGIPGWLFNECYNSVGDLGEMISLVLPERQDSAGERSLAEWFAYLNQLPLMNDDEKRAHITTAWKQLAQYEKFVFNKLLMGSFRVGVSQTLVVRALSGVTGIAANVVAHRLMGKWLPHHTSYHQLLFGEHENDDASKPYPFYLAYAIEGEVSDLGNPGDWQVEWKWDGIRSQVIYRNNELFIWTRGEDLATDKFPELHVLQDLLPDGTVLDGEIVGLVDGRPLPFNMLQTRIGRKNLNKKILKDVPVGFLAYDVLEFRNEDVRHLTQEKRRSTLEGIFNRIDTPSLALSPVISFSSWEELEALHPRSRHKNAEGFMLKHKQSPYQVGRKKGDWWKWKVDPLSVDAVLVYAQKGHGRRAELYTDYTFAVWNEDGKLVPFAKAYSGLTDAEIREVDQFIKRNTLEKFGPVRTDTPELVFEIGFEGINKSPRHKSGIAVRFPRILRWRKDKIAEEADTLQQLQTILDQFV
jgi:DNA ligase 1